MKQAFHLLFAWLVVSLGLPALALDNPRLIQFSGQAVPAVTSPPSAATFTNADGAMTVDPLRAGTGLNFPSVVTYGLGNSNMTGQGTEITVTPAANAIAYRVGVNDQRASSWQYIYAECLNPLTQAIEACDLVNDTTTFPRTNNPLGSPPYNNAPIVVDGGNGWLWVYTPGAWNQNIQSNGLYIDLPPTVRRVFFYAVNNASGGDAIFGSVWVADAPSISKAFSGPVQPGGTSTLTISVKGPGFGGGNGGTAGPVPGLQLTDVLPAPLTVVSASTTCSGGSLTATAGSNSISLADATLPNDGCTVTVDVQWPGTPQGISACLATPTVTNTIDPAQGQFSTAVGQMDTPATADLACAYVAPAAVPAVGGEVLVMTSLGLLGLGLWRGRRRMRVK